MATVHGPASILFLDTVTQVCSLLSRVLFWKLRTQASKHLNNMKLYTSCGIFCVAEANSIAVAGRVTISRLWSACPWLYEKKFILIPLKHPEWLKIYNPFKLTKTQTPWRDFHSPGSKPKCQNDKISFQLTANGFPCTKRDKLVSIDFLAELLARKTHLSWKTEWHGYH